MIANARMYSVTPQVASLWRRLLGVVMAKAGARVEVVDHAPPAPIAELWQRPDMAAVFMCGLPYSVATPRPALVVAPVPSPQAYGGRACYWTDLIVRADRPFETLEQTFGHRLALTTPESQSGFAAPLHHLMKSGGPKPLFAELIEPRFTPMGALTAVIEGKADVAPLDSYAFALLGRYAPELTKQVRVVARHGANSRSGAGRLGRALRDDCRGFPRARDRSRGAASDGRIAAAALCRAQGRGI
jgi:ABC-type phosphate/phosphonate transport system substrate-binding protein